MQTTSRMIVLASSLLGFAGVALGAFGAHALKDTLAARGSASTWQTAVLYQLIHAVALLALAGWGGSMSHARAIGVCWALGVLFFSGSLYWLALGGPRFLGPVTPLGGLLLLAGWLLVAWTAFRPTQS